MNRITLIFCLITGGALSAATERQQDMNVIPSWGDVVIVHGRGTDAAMDSPQAIANIIKHWQGRGFTGVYLRTDLMQYDQEQLIRNPQDKQENARLDVIWKYVDSIMEKFDVHVTMQTEAEKVGFKYWAYHPHLFSDGAPADVGVPGVGRMVPWSYCMRYTYDNPEIVSVDRKGNRHWMIREYAYPGARSSKVDEFVYMAKKFGLKRFVACLRSEALQLLPAPDKADQYGFNEPVVHDMKTMFGVDILTDPRFDVYSPDYDPSDPMVQNWYNLRGTYFTQLLRELRERLNAVDPAIEIAVPLSGDHVGPPMGNWRMDWRTWVDEGLVNEIISPAFFEATIDKDSESKGYLTNVIAGQGTVPFTVLRDYIKNSKHPEIKLIATSAPSYFYPPSSPEGTDGWRCDIWYDLYTLAWYQRWEQWKKDIQDFGHIKFIEQNFDTFPEHHKGHSGGWGDGWYSPDLRACQGCWYKLGDGSTARPVTQSIIKHGDKGNAVKLTASAAGNNTLIGWHASSPDRSTLTGCLDNAITNGRAVFDFWLYRSDEGGAVSVYFQGDDYEQDVGLKVAENTGTVSWSNGGKWTDCSYTVAAGQWQKFSIELDLDNQRYSAYAGTERSVLCSGVTYSVPKSRFVTQHGVDHIPIEVPAYRRFSLVQFIPNGTDGSNVYVDDVAVTWLPTLHYSPPGDNRCFADNFESYPSDIAIADADGKPWLVSQGDSKSYYIEHTTSYGEGVKCLRTQGGADITPDDKSQFTLDKDGIVTVDFDIYLRSDSGFPHIFPNSATKSDHTTMVGLRGEHREYLAAIRNGEGVWQYYDGSNFVDSKTRISYDVWNHVQLAVDVSDGSYKVVIQPLGELPYPVGKADIKSSISRDKPISFFISPSKSEKGFSCYDNIVVTRGPKGK